MTVFVGDILNATAATVTGIPTPTQSWQWLRSGTALPGFTGTSYRVLTGDAGSTLAVRETETNFMGAASATSDPTATVGTWTPSTLFALSEPGVWYDADDYTAMFQDTAGTTPITGAGQTVGLLLDKSKGLVLGSELVTNGDFSSAANWTAGTGWTISGGVASANIAAGVNLDQSLTTTINKTYQVTYTITSFTSGSIRARLTGTANISGTVRGAVGTYTELFHATATNSVFRMTDGGGGFVGTIDNISVKELPGNHATQSTLASRPTTVIRPMNAERRNLLTRTEEFGDAVWAKAGLTISGNQISYAGGSGLTRECVQLVTVPGGTANKVLTAYVTVSGSGKFRLKNTHSAVQDNFSANITATGARQTVVLTVTNSASAGNGFQAISIITSTDDAAFNLTVHEFQLELASSATPYQKVVTTNEWYDPAVPSYRGIQFDGVDDFLVSSTVDPTTGPTGPDLITNGNFSGGTTGWTLGASWAVSGGTANYNNAGAAQAISQTVTLTAGVSYLVTYTVPSFSSGFVYPRLVGATTVNGTSATAAGTYREVIVAPASPTTLGFVAQGVMSIDNISVKEIVADKAQVFAGVRKLSDAASGILVELSATVANNGTFAVAVPNAPDDRYLFGSRGTTQTNASTQSSSYNAPTTSVLSGLGDIAGDSSTLRINGAQIARNTGEQGTGTYLAYPLYIGRRGGSTLPYNGILTSLVVRFGANLSTSVINRAEYYVSDKTGVSL